MFRFSGFSPRYLINISVCLGSLSQCPHGVSWTQELWRDRPEALRLFSVFLLVYLFSYYSLVFEHLHASNIFSPSKLLFFFLGKNNWEKRRCLGSNDVSF